MRGYLPQQTPFYLFWLPWQLPHTQTWRSHKAWGTRNEMASIEAPYFLFSEQFSYLYGYRDVYDSINWASNNDRRKNLLAIPIHEWSRKNYFISPQLFVYMFSGIWTSDSHKYTKNVCMTGHNIKYHQNKRNEMEELEGFSLSLRASPNQHPRSTTVSFSVWVTIRTKLFSMSGENISQRISCMLTKKQNLELKLVRGRRSDIAGG